MVVTFVSTVGLFGLKQVLEIGDVAVGGGGVAFMPECESIVECECGLIILSETVDADDESILIVDFEFDGDIWDI